MNKDVFVALFRREFYGYFRSPVGYVFMGVFLLASVGSTFFLGGLYESNQASLAPFFNYLPWLYLVLVPAVGMRLWAEERKVGTIELLFTLPISMGEAVVAKFVAGWAFIGIALILTFPLWVTVSYLGDPDHGVILAGYLGSWLMAGAYLAITCFTSAITKNQVISFIISVVICFGFVLMGWGVFSSFLGEVLPSSMVDFIAGLGFVPHFSGIAKGLVDSRDVVYFGSVIAISLAINTFILNAKKAV
jgi:ABC-2 type transport system permease protein